MAKSIPQQEYFFDEDSSTTRMYLKLINLDTNGKNISIKLVLRHLCLGFLYSLSFPTKPFQSVLYLNTL